MPEVITKYPQQLMELLKSAKMQCGDSITKPLILKTCPSANFCKIPEGEICVYSVHNAKNMAQFGTLDFLQIPMVMMPLLLIFFIIFLLGFLTGTKLAKKKMMKYG